MLRKERNTIYDYQMMNIGYKAIKHTEEFPSKVWDTLEGLFRRLITKYGEPIGDGRNRIVFGNEWYVFKIPRTASGFSENVLEHQYYRGRNAESFPMASCKLVHVCDIPILVMELVKELPYDYDREEIPWWVDFIDCQQVGLNRAGNLVAYDYA